MWALIIACKTTKRDCVSQKIPSLTIIPYVIADAMQEQILNQNTDLAASQRMCSGNQRWDWNLIHLWRSHVSLATLQLAEDDKNVINNVYDAWSVSGFLMDVGSLCQHPPIASEWFPLFPLNAWIVVSSVRSMLAAIFVQTWPLL